MKFRTGWESTSVRHAERIHAIDDDAAGLALGHSSRGRSRPPVKSPLTKRETQIANLVADGLSNRANSETLVLSTHTIDGRVKRNPPSWTSRHAHRSLHGSQP
ncbi:LuxR C-terminal-related transcriptional regulator [Rhodococcus opacus]|uniref:LuxR C-terminal-related transcriptional regulator n=1 Tax=Rhodococcus opacus TaxID=37919 RepID=UPI00358EAA4D